MRTITIDEAKAELSRLVDQAALGDVFVITKAGKAMVKVVPLESLPTSTERRLGFMADQIAIPDDFDQWGREEVEKLFLGGK